jgi:hypothetical protein
VSIGQAHTVAGRRPVERGILAAGDECHAYLFISNDKMTR